MTPTCTLIDCYPAFLEYWERASHLTIDAQIEAWAKVYMFEWPELLKLQIENYEQEGEDWRLIAREHVFYDLGDRLPAMRIAHGNLLELCEPLCRRAYSALGLEFQIAFLIYVGIGCGAGWAAEYKGDPAVLLGLENIAEEGWQSRSALEGLLAHEIGHLAHFHWRNAAGLRRGDSTWWQLYSEGFAQYCEHRVLGRETWHMAAIYGEDWLNWCRENRAWLANEFLRTLQTGGALRPFFGSWYQLRGYKQTGYFLGHEIVKSLVVKKGLRQTALLADVEIVMQEAIEELAAA
jgi:hypothetical protein